MHTVIRRLCGGALAALLLTAFTATSADASHFRFGKVECAPTGTAGEVSCEVTSGWRRSFFSGPPNVGDNVNVAGLTWGDGTSESLVITVTSASPAQDLFIGSATFTHTYASSGVYEVGFSSCCRIGALRNRDNGNYDIRSTIDVDVTAANSIDPTPVTSVAPVTGFAKSGAPGSPARITIPVNDPNGEAVSCALSGNNEAGGGPSPAGLTVNPDCTVDWDNSTLANGLYTIQVNLQELDGSGNPSGNVTVVDFILDLGVDTGTAPICSFDVASPYVVDVGSAVQFTVTGTDADAGDTVELSAVTVPAFGTMSPTLPISGASPQASTFNGTAPATPGQAFATYSVTDGVGNTASCDLTIQYVPVTTGLVCAETVLLDLGDFDTNGDDATYGEFVEVANGETSDVDLSSCSFATFDPFTERVISTSPTPGSVAASSSYFLASMNGDQAIAPGSIFDGPGALVLLEGTTSVGASVADVLPNVVAAIVYRAEDDIFAEVSGGGTPVTREEQRRAFALALASIGSPVADEDGADTVDLAVVASPNPVRSRASVTFGVAEATDVRVAVYDALGREVALLAEAPFGTGRHAVDFEAQGLPAGIYVVRAVVGAEARTTRMTVVR